MFSFLFLQTDALNGLSKLASTYTDKRGALPLHISSKQKGILCRFWDQGVNIIYCNYFTVGFLLQGFYDKYKYIGIKRAHLLYLCGMYYVVSNYCWLPGLTFFMWLHVEVVRVSNKFDSHVIHCWYHYIYAYL